jgi:hypothetical protein
VSEPLTKVRLEVIGVELKVFPCHVGVTEFLPNMVSFDLFLSQSALEPGVIFLLPFKVVLHGLISHVCLIFVVDASIHASVISLEPVKVSIQIFLLSMNPFELLTHLIESPLK